jgi:hypothetical protein
MEKFDLTKEADRLAIVDRIFTYPQKPHRRKHGPRYTSYESYRDWLRDEFSFRCVFSLVRETWPWASGNFDIDHLEPQASHPDEICKYDNLLYLQHRINLIRGKRPIPDPCRIALGKCIGIITNGDRIGQIETFNETGERIVSVFKLNSDDAVANRTKWLGIMRSLARTDEGLFRQFVGYPTELPDLRKMRNKENTRKAGLKKSARVLQALGRLPEWC